MDMDAITGIQCSTTTRFWVPAISSNEVDPSGAMSKSEAISLHAGFLVGLSSWMGESETKVGQLRFHKPGL